jgi:hypothetical protein
VRESNLMAGEQYLIKILVDIENDKQLAALNKRLGEVSKSVPKAQKAMKSAGKDTKAFGRVAQNSSYQVQDLIVQISGGVDPMRALSQQLPQMLVGMGAWAAVIGVVAAGLPILILAMKESTATAEDAAKSWDKYTESLKRFNETGVTTDAILTGIDRASAIEDRSQAIAGMVTQLEKLSNITKQGQARTASIIGQFGSITEFERFNEILKDFNGQNIEDTTRDLLQLSSGMEGFASQDTIDRIEELARGLRDLQVATTGAARASSFTQAAVAANDYTQTLEEVKQAEYDLLQVQLKREANAREAAAKASARAAAEAQRLRAQLKDVTAQTEYKKSDGTADAARRIELNDRRQLQEENLQAEYDLTAQAAVESFNIQDEAMQIFSDTFETAFDGVAMGTQSVSDAFENMTKSILVQLAKLAATQFFGNMLSGQGGTLGAIGNNLLGKADGGVFHNGIEKFAKGGVVSSPTLFPMAKGAGLMGEGAGPEAILPLSRMSNGNLGVESQAMNVTVNNNAPGVDISTRQTESGLTVDVVAQTIASAIQRGGNDVANALENTYSLGRGRAVY